MKVLGQICWKIVHVGLINAYSIKINLAFKIWPIKIISIFGSDVLMDYFYVYVKLLQKGLSLKNLKTDLKLKSKPSIISLSSLCFQYSNMMNYSSFICSTCNWFTIDSLKFIILNVQITVMQPVSCIVSKTLFSSRM